jgi:hypothetical protein
MAVNCHRPDRSATGPGTYFGFVTWISGGHGHTVEVSIDVRTRPSEKNERRTIMTALVYERPTLVEVGAFADLTRGHRGRRREHRRGHRRQR